MECVSFCCMKSIMTSVPSQTAQLLKELEELRSKYEGALGLVERQSLELSDVKNENATLYDVRSLFVYLVVFVRSLIYGGRSLAFYRHSTKSSNKWYVGILAPLALFQTNNSVSTLPPLVLLSTRI